VTPPQRFKRRPWILSWLPVLVWMGCIFFLSAQPDLPHIETGWVDLLASWGAHLLLFGVLAMLWMRALGSRRHAAIMALILAGLYGVADEFHQGFVPGRDPSLADLVCDLVGAAAGVWLCARLRSPVGPRAVPRASERGTGDRNVG
jgi:VanZ family protein